MKSSDSSYTFRLAVEADAEALVALVNGAYRGDSGRLGWTTEADLIDGVRVDIERIYEIVRDPACTLLVGSNSSGRIIACVHLQRLENGIAYLGMLTVQVGLQAAGLGRQLLQMAEEYVRDSWNAHEMEMNVIVGRDELIHWYLRRGYRLTSEMRPFPYGDARFGVPFKEGLRFVVLRKDLETRST